MRHILGVQTIALGNDPSHCGSRTRRSCACFRLRADKAMAAAQICRKQTRALSALCACLLCIGTLDLLVSRAWATYPRRDAALGYYTAALKGAARVTNYEPQSTMFKRLAKLHYRAAELRRQRKWDGASAVYRTALTLYTSMPPPKEVPSFAAAACTWLNLALTEKNNGHFDTARRVFQDGTRFVQELMQKDLDVRIDGQNRLRSRTVDATSSSEVQVACKWLATLLVAWGLLETKLGFRLRAKVLAERAANLDVSKAKVLSWKVVQGV